MSPPEAREVLGVGEGAGGDDVKAAYERAKRQLGPDSLATYALVDPSEAQQMLARIEDAYQLLGGGNVESKGVSPVDEERKEAPAEPAKPAEAPPPPVEAKAPEPKPEAGAKVDPAEAKAAEAKPVEAKPAEAEPAKPVRKTEAELPADAPVTGEALRRVREAYGFTLKDLETKTKIGHWHLDNIEKEKFTELPALVYLRGFLQSLARELKLDPIRVARSYLEGMQKARGEKKEG